MAKATMKLPDKLLMHLSRLGERTDEIVEKMLAAGGEVVETEVRSSLRGVLSGQSTGELLSSLGVTPVGQDKDGALNVKIGFAEPRREQNAAKGKRSYKTRTNAMIANVLEYGRHNQPPRPFIEPAQKACRNACIAAMKARFDEEVGKK